MKSLFNAVKKYPTYKKWAVYALIAVPFIWLGNFIFKKLKTSMTLGTSGFWAAFNTKEAAASAAAAAAASGNTALQNNVPKYGEPYDAAKCEGIVATIKEAFGWNDDEESIIEALNSCTNGTEVKYCSELYKIKYAQSLKAKVTATLNRSEKDKLSTIVQTNWF